MGKWKDMADKIRETDKNAVDDIQYVGGMTIENSIALANARAVTAVAAICQILEHLDAEESAQVMGGE